MQLSSIAMLGAVLLAGCREQSSIARNLTKVGSQIPKTVRTALEEGQDFELYSLDPKHRDDEKPSEFLCRKVIGKTLIKDAAARKEILEAFENAEVQSVHVKCFDPRHAIRVRNEGKTFYLTICFECENVYAFVEGSDEKPRWFKTAGTPEAVFDKILKGAGVPLAEKGNLEDKLERRPEK